MPGEAKAQVLGGKRCRFSCFATERGTYAGCIWLELRPALPVWRDRLMTTELKCQQEK